MYILILYTLLVVNFQFFIFLSTFARTEISPGRVPGCTISYIKYIVDLYVEH